MTHLSEPLWRPGLQNLTSLHGEAFPEVHRKRDTTEREPCPADKNAPELGQGRYIGSEPFPYAARRRRFALSSASAVIVSAASLATSMDSSASRRVLVTKSSRLSRARLLCAATRSGQLRERRTVSKPSRFLRKRSCTRLTHSREMSWKPRAKKVLHSAMALMF